MPEIVPVIFSIVAMPLAVAFGCLVGGLYLWIRNR